MSDHLASSVLETRDSVAKLGPVLSVPFEEVSQLVKRHSTEPLQHIH